MKKLPDASHPMRTAALGNSANLPVALGLLPGIRVVRTRAIAARDPIFVKVSEVNKRIANGKFERLRGEIRRRWGQLTAISPGSGARSGALSVKPLFDRGALLSGALLTSALLASGLAIALPAFAQEGSASLSMHQAGESAENAASSSGQAIEDAAHGTATAVIDPAITAEVKTALHHDDTVAKDAIQVTTVAGVVTLTGQVQSPDESKRAEELAKQAGGVKSVENQLTLADKVADKSAMK